MSGQVGDFQHGDPFGKLSNLWKAIKPTACIGNPVFGELSKRQLLSPLFRPPFEMRPQDRVAIVVKVSLTWRARGCLLTRPTPLCPRHGQETLLLGVLREP